MDHPAVDSRDWRPVTPSGIGPILSPGSSSCTMLPRSGQARIHASELSGGGIVVATLLMITVDAHLV